MLWLIARQVERGHKNSEAKKQEVDAASEEKIGKKNSAGPEIGNKKYDEPQQEAQKSHF